ncbi:hypothetical protein [Nafulsella turpanensis]|uniref:hypothetical protein n=1 Tax=Nafulsella turpanensis TaxID=1265690 RepID=UPI0003493D33|nr:hypothetical protein [Nafulsella turpanensis]
MNTNIDKKAFNVAFQEYINISDQAEANRFYNKHIHADLLTIISNALHHWDFSCSSLVYEDTVADLLFHIQYKKEKGVLNQYATGKNNYYNLVFSIILNKFRDICKGLKIKERKLNKMLELAAEHLLQSTEVDEEEEVKEGFSLSYNNTVTFSAEPLNKKMQMISKKLMDLTHLTTDDRQTVADILESGFAEAITTKDPDTGIHYINLIIHPELRKLIGNV